VGGWAKPPRNAAAQQPARHQGDGHQTLNTHRTMTTNPNAKQRQRIDSAPESWRGILTKAITGKASPRAAIKAQCGECNGFDRDAIRECTADACPLHPYRPFRNVPKPSQASSRDSKDAFSRAGSVNTPHGNRCAKDATGEPLCKS